MSEDSTTADEHHEVAVVGGGPAGLTAALYATRLGHDTVVIDRGGGRAAMMAETHNVVGITEETSGDELLETAKRQVEDHGAEVRRGFVTDLSIPEDGGPRFHLETTDGDLRAERVVLATGFTDERPEPPLPRTARGLHYCLHCDAAVFEDDPVYVMGHDESAAKVAMIMLNFAEEVDLLTRGEDPEWSAETDRQLRAHPVERIDADVSAVENGDDGWLEAIEFEDGSRREYAGGFAMYGADYNNDLALAVGAETDEDGQILVGDHGETSVDGLYAVGDVTPGHAQIPVAMGQGARAGIDIHYDLRTYPKSVEELEAEGALGVDEVPADD